MLKLILITKCKLDERSKSETGQLFLIYLFIYCAQPKGQKPTGKQLSLKHPVDTEYLLCKPACIRRCGWVG
jgi:hypothetical protein